MPVLSSMLVISESMSRRFVSMGGCIGVRNVSNSSSSSSSSSSIYFNSTTSISQYSNKCIQYRHNGKSNTFLDIR